MGEAEMFVSFEKVLSVCGPDPYTKRNWYASVRNTNGKITVE